MRASQSQAMTSWPGGLVVSSRRYSARRRVASSVMLSQLGACHAVLIRPPAAPPGRLPSRALSSPLSRLSNPRRSVVTLRTLLRRVAMRPTMQGASMTAAITSGSGPLAGLRVLDMSWVLAGPFCTMTLSDLGADVVKCERPPYGDVARTTGPLIDGESGYFFSVNRGKRSIAIDLKQDEGRALFLRLARD